jgi:hypothetical protein
MREQIAGEEQRHSSQGLFAAALPTPRGLVLA